MPTSAVTGHDSPIPDIPKKQEAKQPPPPKTSGKVPVVNKDAKTAEAAKLQSKTTAFKMGEVSTKKDLDLAANFVLD